MDPAGGGQFAIRVLEYYFISPGRWLGMWLLSAYALSTGFTVRGDKLHCTNPYGVNAGTQTPSPLLRRQVLYPIELRTHGGGTGWN